VAQKSEKAMCHGKKVLAVKSGVRLGGRWKLSARHGEIPWVN
jgi:hypothetical protein